MGAGISDYRDNRRDLWFWWRCRCGGRNREAPVLHIPGDIRYHLDYWTHAARAHSWNLSELLGTAPTRFVGPGQAGFISGELKKPVLDPESLLSSKVFFPQNLTLLLASKSTKLKEALHESRRISRHW